MKIKGILILSLILVAALTAGCGSSGDGGTATTTTGGGSTAQQEVAAPAIVITSPTGKDGYTTNSASVTVIGTSIDNTSVSGVAWTNSAGGSGSATLSSDTFTASSIPLTSGDNTITLTATDSEAHTSSDSILVVYNPYITFSSAPIFSQDYVYVNESTAITVRIGVASGSNIDTSSMKLLKVNSDNTTTSLGAMTDNGNTSNGDDIANDNIYSGIFTFNETSAGAITLRVTVNTTESSGAVAAYSEKFTITALTRLTSAELSAATTITTDAETQYGTYLLTMSEADAKTALVSWLKEQSGITEAGLSPSGNSVWWANTSGILGGLFLSDDTVQNRGGGSNMSVSISPRLKSANVFKDAAAGTTTVGSNRAILIGSFHTQFEGWGGDEVEEINTALTNSSCPKFSVDGPYYDVDATVEKFKLLANYGTIVVTAHGDTWYTNPFDFINPDRFGGSHGIIMNWLSQVVVLTRTVVTDATKATYESDLQMQRLVIAGRRDGTQYFAITPGFITYYNSGMKNSLVYIGSCRSVWNNTMTSAFLAAGASVVYGYTDYVDSLFAYNHGKDIFTDLITNAKQSGSVSGLGDNDADGDPATLVYRGASNVTLNVSGLANGSFEDGSSIGWVPSGDYRVLTNIGDVSAQDGKYLGLISTGLGTYDQGDTPNVASELSQAFCVPAGIATLSFEYDVLSEEPMCYVGSVYDDTFTAKILDASGTELTTLATETVNTSSWTFLGGDYFPGGDTYATPQLCTTSRSDGTYHVGWKTKTYDVSSYAGTSTPITLKFHVEDQSDSIWDTAVTIDKVELQ